MRTWFERIAWKISGWMQGRYGRDKLSKHLVVLAFIFIVFSIFDPSGILSLLTLVCLVVSLYRGFSKNIEKRKKELESYERLLAKPGQFISLQKLRIKERKTHKFFRCECGAILRVPKGQGKIEVTCPKCKMHTIRKT